MRFSKKDLIFSLFTGFYTGFIAWKIFEFVGVPRFQGISYAWLLIFIPILWILGVNLGYFLGRWLPFFNQFGKFAAIGFTNAAVDFGILNLLIFYTAIASGLFFSLFKSISFVVAVTHSYFWNKYWAFEAGKVPVSREEFSKFFVITLIALLVNVGVASFAVNIIGPLFGLSAKAWANVGAVAGSALALVFSFAGFRMFVFKK